MKRLSFHKKVLNSIHEGFACCRIKNNDYIITFANNSFFNIFELSKDSLHKPISQIDNFLLKKIFSQIDKKQKIESCYNKKFVIASVFFLSKDEFILITEDNTQKKFFENKFLIYKKFTDQANQGLLICEISGKIIYMNKFLKNLICYLPGERNENIIDLYESEFAKIFNEKIKKVLIESEEKQWEFESKIVTRYNSIVPVSSNFFLINNKYGSKYIANVVTDISEKTIANQKILENEQILKKLQKIAKLGTWEYNLSTGYVSLSEEMCSILEIKSKNWDIKIDDLKEFIQQDFIGNKLNFTALKDIKNIDNLNLKNREIKITTSKNCYKYLKIDGELLKDENGPYKVLGTCIDITQNIELEKREQQTQKLQTIEQFSAGIAHNFNNILTIISGYADLIQRNDCTENDVKVNAQEIKKAVKSASELTSKIVSKQKSIVKTINLDEAIKSITNLCRQMIRNDVSFEVNVNSFCNIDVDESQLEQIILNLISNSSYAVNEREDLKTENKKILVSTRALDYKEIINEHLNQEKKYALIEVYDNGTGISPEISNKIFDPFFTTKKRGEGSGLGLSTVLSIIKRYEAHISFDSIPDERTIFKVFWPISEKNIENKTISIIKEVKEIENLKILLVEDEPTLRLIAKSFFEKQGHQIILVKNGKEALKKLEEINYDVDIIISDIIMPEMSGSELYEEIKKIKPRMKMLFITGYIDEKSKITNYIQKPYELKDLLRRVYQILQEV